MGDAGRARFEVELAQHYASKREAAASEAVDGLVSMMVAEDERFRDVRSHRMGFAEFVASQVRYIPAWTWAAQAALVACMCALAHVSQIAMATKLAIGMLAAATVLVGVPTLHASKRHGVAELEFACPHNAASVLVARLIVLGCSSALAVAIMVGATATSLDLSAFDVALWAVPPYFISCAGCLMALRKAPPSTATALCTVWTLACSGALAVLANTHPDMYANASLVVWAGAAAVTGAWLAREVAMTMRTAREGLDAFSPHLARTYN